MYALQHLLNMHKHSQTETSVHLYPDRESISGLPAVGVEALITLPRRPLLYIYSQTNTLGSNSKASSNILFNAYVLFKDKSNAFFKFTSIIGL